MKKTVTIFRYPVSGANCDMIEARYRGVTLNWYKDGRQESAQEKYAGDDSIDRINSRRSVSDSLTLISMDGPANSHLRTGNSNVPQPPHD